jgi:hypothetical protein
MSGRDVMTQRRNANTQDDEFWESLKEASRFVAGSSRVHRTMRGLVVKFEKAKIPYAILGGMAVNAHGRRQTTDDVDVLLSPQAFVQFRERIAEGNYHLKTGRRWRFIDRANGIPVDFVLAGTSPGWLRPSPVVYPDPENVTEMIDGVCYVNLRTLVELKLATYRYRDFADVTALIKARNLDESFAEQLDPTVRPDFIVCLEEKRRDEEFDARDD